MAKVVTAGLIMRRSMLSRFSAVTSVILLPQEMKFQLTAAIVSYLACTQAFAQSPGGGSLAGSADQKSEDRAGSKSAPRFEAGKAEWRIRELNAMVENHPGQKEYRLRLVDALETLGKFYETRDTMKATRYYEAAAHTLNNPPEKDWKKRADQDSKKADHYRQIRMTYLRGLETKGFTFTSFNWRKIKGLDPKDASDYTGKVNQPIRSNWSVARRITEFSLEEVSKPAIIVNFNIHKDGSISDIKVTKSCGRPKIDQIALEAVQKVSKMPPLLPAMGEVIPVETQFIK